MLIYKPFDGIDKNMDIYTIVNRELLFVRPCRTHLWRISLRSNIDLIDIPGRSILSVFKQVIMGILDVWQSKMIIIE